MASTGVAILAASFATAPMAQAEQVIELGLSTPLSGAAAAIWDKGSEFMCETAADEIREGGGVSGQGEAYYFEWLSYDNKCDVAEGTKVAQALLIREISEMGVDILLIEQNAEIALTIAGYGCVLETGKVIMQDKADVLLQNPQVQMAYLGI